MNYLDYPVDLPCKTLHHRPRYENRDKFAAIAGYVRNNSSWEMILSEDNLWRSRHQLNPDFPAECMNRLRYIKPQGANKASGAEKGSKNYNEIGVF